MKAVTFKYDTIFKKNMSFTMQISDELYDALKIQDKMQDFRVSEIMDDISSMLSIVAELQGVLVQLKAVIVLILMTIKKITAICL